MTRTALTAAVKAAALDAGFDMAGVTRASLPPLHEKSLNDWLAEGREGTMEYMRREPARRAHPETFMPSVRSAVCLAVNYFHPDDPHPGVPAGKVAKYAYGADYHDVMGARLERFAARVREIGGEGTETKTYVDTGPVLERAFAQNAGLAFFGKNTNLISLEYGSWFFLATLFTNLELDADAPHAGSCGSCRLCIDACPTGALLGDYALDARRCISYATIEAKGEAGADTRARAGEWIFGCDVCQDVCPYNRRAKTTRHAELWPRRAAGTWVALAEAEAMDEAAFRERFRGSPVKRAKLTGLKRNAEALKASA